MAQSVSRRQFVFLGTAATFAAFAAAGCTNGGQGNKATAGGNYKDGTYSGESSVLEAGVDGDGYGMITVTVENGAINGQSERKVSPYSRVTVTAATAPEGKQFAYWAFGGADGTPISYDPVYTFIVTGDTALTAVYSDTASQAAASIAMDPASANHVTQVNGAYTLMYSGKITLPEGATIQEFGMVLTDQASENCTAETLVIGGERVAKLTATQMTENGQYKMTVNNVAAGATRTGRLYAVITLADGTTETIYSSTWSELNTPNT